MTPPGAGVLGVAEWVGRLQGPDDCRCSLLLVNVGDVAPVCPLHNDLRHKAKQVALHGGSPEKTLEFRQKEARLLSCQRRRAIQRALLKLGCSLAGRARAAPAASAPAKIYRNAVRIPAVVARLIK